MDDLNAIESTSPADNVEVFTVGHSTMPFENFVSNIKKAGVTAIADVRSSPFSRRYPHFSQKSLRLSLKENRIKYVFLGEELGGRPKSNRLYCDGVADYEKMALEPEFHEGLGRVVKGSKTHRIALMCSEHSPLDCHRCLLVGRALAENGAVLKHILYDGKVITQADVEERLLSEVSGDGIDDLFASRSERLAVAYRSRAQKVAFRKPVPQDPAHEVQQQNAHHEAAE